jgi:glycosyltransferase involved in cell wall biosynthesis/Tfp pilus assembly protein PilF
MRTKDNIRGKIEQGETLFLEGRLQESRVCFLTLLEQTPVNAEILNNLGAVCHAEGKMDDAEEYFLRAISTDGENMDARFNIINLLQEAGRIHEAAPHLEKVLGTYADDFDTFNQLGMIALETGDVEKAYMYLAKSLKLNPQQDEIRRVLADINKMILSASAAERNPDTYSLSQATDCASAPFSKNPDISIGFTVYNGGESSRKAIESILAQDFKDFELIISDNASTDNTSDICREYARLDNRIRYERRPENIGMKKNMLHVLGAARGKYFMFMQHDNRHDPRFLSACLERYKNDGDSIVLVYPQTRVYSQGIYKGIIQDNLEADGNDPITRFRRIIYNLDMCNAMLGLFRKEAITRTSSLNADLYRGGDHLFLAELALLGKIIQIPDVLFSRGFNRNYQASPEEINTKLIRDCFPEKLNDGITFPFCRLIYAHLEMINRLDSSWEIKETLMKDVLQCYRVRFGDQMRSEIAHAINMIEKGRFLNDWENASGKRLKFFTLFHINSLTRRLLEAQNIFPEFPELNNAIATCYNLMVKNLGFSPSGENQIFSKNEVNAQGGISA